MTTTTDTGLRFDIADPAHLLLLAAWEARKHTDPDPRIAAAASYISFSRIKTDPPTHPSEIVGSIRRIIEEAPLKRVATPEEIAKSTKAD